MAKTDQGPNLQRRAPRPKARPAQGKKPRAKAPSPVQPRFTPPAARSSLPLGMRIWRTLDSLAMRAGRRLLGRVLGRAVEFTVYVLLAITIGLGSAWTMIQSGSRLTVERDGPWLSWVAAGSPDADPYTRAHFALNGALPLERSAARYYTATRDSGGDPLYADCDYKVSGSEPAGRRWTLAAYDMTGTALAPGLGSGSISSDTAVPSPGGLIAIRIAQATTPGHWLSLAGGARMQLLLTVYARTDRTPATANARPEQQLFNIEKAGCR
jgi:hypothetical protein